MGDDVPSWVWITFSVVLLGLLAIDLFVHRGEGADTKKRAFIWTGVWIAAGLSFNIFVWMVLGGGAAQEYLAAYLIEKSLSLDNLFVFLVIFKSLRIPEGVQRNVLSWGIFGALVFRAIFIFLGAAAVERWEFVSYVFGGVLVLAALRIIREDPATQKENRVVGWLSRHLPVTSELHGTHFFAKLRGRTVVTPLFIALVAIELTDITFAIDSVPAAFAVTHHEFVIFSSNAFAILGLRALYIALAATIAKLEYLHFGLAGVLAFAGFKLVTARWIHITPFISIAVILAMISVAALVSIWHGGDDTRANREARKVRRAREQAAEG